jgi:hypothetical protein
MVDYYRVSKDTKFGAILSKSIISLLAIFALYLIYLNFWYSVEYNTLLYTFLVIPVFAIIYLISHKLKIPPVSFAITIFVLAFLFKSILVLMTDTTPVSDFNTFYQCAVRLLNGDKAFGHTFYFKTWAYQTGPVLYYSAIMKLFGTGLLPLKLVNCFFMAGTNLLIYLFARKISNDYTARFVSLLYLLYPAPYFLAAVLTNQHFAAFMFLLAVYILAIKRLNWAVKGIIAGVIMSLGNTVRPLGILIVAATMLWGLVETIRSKKVVKIGVVVLLVITYSLVNFGSSTMVKHADINPDGLANNFPLWKFVVGFNYDSKWQFSYKDQNDIFYIKDANKRNMISKQVIRERLSIGPSKLVNLLNTKQIAMWAGLDTLRWEFYQQIDGKLIPPKELEKYEPTILKTEKMYYIFIFILMFLGLCKVFVNKRVLPEVTLLSLLLLCYFGAHILIEIQVRYRYFAVIIVFILAAKGSELLFRKLNGYGEPINRQY